MNKLWNWILLQWKKFTRDYKIEVKSLKLLTPYLLLINFKADECEMYLTIDGNYKDLYKKHHKRSEEAKQNDEIISFDNYMEEINLLIPTEDIIIIEYKNWKRKL
jgi:hypothetical protein